MIFTLPRLPAQFQRRQGINMNDARQPRAPFLIGMLLTIATLVPTLLQAQDGSVAIPEHASALSYGPGWQCDRGYRKDNGTCAAIVVPANAFLNTVSVGRGWECMRGYRTVENTCVAIAVPPNAYLDGSERWRCNREYRKVAESCVPVELPEHAYFDDSGEGWDCDRGYREAGASEAGASCVAIQVPANGYLTNLSYGTGWACERGYRAVDGACVVVEVPANGYYVDASYGSGWNCRRGYAAQGLACVALEMPANAHLDYSGSSWDCDPPYRRRLERCELP
jgi:hypothetical protein